MVDTAITSTINKYIHVLNNRGLPVEFGVVFGSQVTGQTHEWSDIDLLVVSPVFDGPFDRENINLLWRVAARTDSRIEPIACGSRQWREDDGTPIIEVARQEGVIVYPKSEDVRQAG